MVNVKILLDNVRPVYYPGQHLKGTAELTLREVKKIRAFYIKVFGRARAHWKETESGTVETENRNIVNYKGVEILIDTKTFLFGHEGGPTLEIQPGTHRYTFDVQLPSKLPYTMDAEFGNIEYFIEAKLDIPWRFDKEIKLPFKVVRLDDLNIYPELAIAQKFEEFKTFCCFLCKSGTLLMTVSIPCTGFVTEQDVSLKIDYVNKSNIDVDETHIKLNRTIAFTSHTPHRKTKCSTKKLIEVYAEGVKGNDENSIEVVLTIPETLENSNEKFCQVIKVSYSIEVIGVVNGWHSNLDIDFPITIGSVPIGQQNRSRQTAPLPTMDQQFPVSPVIPSIMRPPMMTPDMIPTAPPASNDFDSDLPPSFEEATRSQNYMQQPTQNTIGWNISQPSAPPS